MCTNSIGPSIFMSNIPRPILSLQFIPLTCLSIQSSNFIRKLDKQLITISRSSFIFLLFQLHSLIFFESSWKLPTYIAFIFIFKYQYNRMFQNDRNKRIQISIIFYIIIYLTPKYVNIRQLANKQMLEFKFIYDDLKQQIKEIPHLQQQLRLTQKSTKKLQCINLYSVSDKRDFDLEIQQQQIMEQIKKLYESINQVKQSLNEELINQIAEKIENVKNKNIQIFDLLNKQDQLLMKQIQVVQYSLEQQHNQNQIKQQDQFDEQFMKDSNKPPNNQQKINSLKKQIDQIGIKLAKINHGKGKWILSDHNDFVKIYNRCAANGKKIIQEGIKILGMKNTEIMDHLQLYENFLQLQKQKKIITQEYKQIKLLQKMQQDQKKQKQKLLSVQKKKLKKQKQSQQNEKKKELLNKFKEKRQQQKLKMIEQQQRKEKQKIIKIPLPPSKKKQIIERNQKFIAEKQNNLKKTQQQKISANNTRTSLQRKKQQSVEKLHSKKSSQDGKIQQIHK